MVINGKPGLACHTQTADLPDKITLHPLPVFKLIGDLSVDTGTWFRNTGKKIESWIHTNKNLMKTPRKNAWTTPLRTRFSNLTAAWNAAAAWRLAALRACGEDFMGATAINRLARFYIDPRDNRTPADFYEVIGDDQGVFGCMGLLACDNVCPKQIPLQDQLGIMRRMATLESVKAIIPEFLRKKLMGCKSVKP